jgi:hypothetical protein
MWIPLRFSLPGIDYESLEVPLAELLEKLIDKLAQ